MEVEPVSFSVLWAIVMFVALLVFLFWWFRS